MRLTPMYTRIFKKPFLKFRKYHVIWGLQCKTETVEYANSHCATLVCHKSRLNSPFSFNPSIYQSDIQKFNRKKTT